MEKKNKYWLNEYGERYWYKKTNMSIVAYRPYSWKDSVSFIDEGSVHYAENYGWSTGNRKYINSITYSEFKKQKNDWIPIKDHKEYAEKLMSFLYSPEEVEKLKLESNIHKYNL